MADPQALPFELYIQALPTGSYRVTVTNAPSGPASVEIPAPFTFTDLAQLGAVIDGRAGLASTDQAARLKTFGTALFSAIISGQVAEAYTASQARAGRAGLNIRLQLDQAGLLRGIPWSLLTDPAGGRLTITPPKSFYNVRSVGGLRETVLRPGVLAPLLVIVVLLIGGVVGGLLSILDSAPSNVDLVVTSLHFFPPKPVPGQIISVSLTIANKGTSDAGKFDWAWYENPITNQTMPDMTGQVAALTAGSSVTVKGDIIFGWWGQYLTTAWVNPSGFVRETNSKNNFNSGTLNTSNDPFQIDWTILPDTSLITSEKDLHGDEFNDWGLTIAPQADSLTNPNPACASAVAKIEVSTDDSGDQINRLVTGLPAAPIGASGFGSIGTPTKTPIACDATPLLFTLSHPIGSVTINFASARGGNYTLAVADADGNPLGNANKTVAPGGQESLTVALNNSTPPSPKVQIAFSGGDGDIQITGMTFTKASG